VLNDDVNKNWKGLTLLIAREVPDQLTLDGNMDGHETRLQLRRVDRNKFFLAGCGKTTARLKMLARFRDFRDKGRVLVASDAACRSFSSTAWR